MIMGIPLGPIDSKDPAIQVYKNLPPRPSTLRLLAAKLFGQKVVTVDSGVEVTSYKWRGALYISRVNYLGHWPETS
jgi:hypothetical protein